MNSKILKYLFVFTYLVWLIPWQGKQLMPSWFGSSLIQWSSLVLQAISGSIGALFSLSLLAEKHRRDGFLYLMGFALPALFCICAWAITAAILSRAASAIQPQYKDIEVIAQLVESARDTNMPSEKRVRASSLLYRIWGITTVVLSRDGRLVTYEPTIEDKGRWQKTLDVDTTAKKSLALFRWQLNQIPWLTGIFVCTSTLVFFAGLGFYTFRRQENQVG